MNMLNFRSHNSFDQSWKHSEIFVEISFYNIKIQDNHPLNSFSNDHLTLRQPVLHVHSLLNVEYQIEYRNSDRRNEEDGTSILEELTEMILRLGCFLGRTVRCCAEDDPILRMINRLIRQEEEICLSKQGEYLNPQLLQKLKQLKNDYEQRRNSSNEENESVDLDHAYEILERMGTIDSIKKELTLNTSNQTTIN
jgi:hypothetical protein